MRPFLVCIHDATPAYQCETRALVRGLEPLIGRRFSCGVVPDWHGAWPLAAHPEYCRFLRESAEELLLHGYSHRRRRGWGATTMLTAGSDEMNGLDAGETQRALETGQRVFSDIFGEPARGFLPPGWQPGHVRAGTRTAAGLDYLVRFFSIDSQDGRRIPLATWSWDCGRWGWLGHVGDRVGRFSHVLNGGVPTLAIHPRDLERGFWPRIAGVTRRLLDNGYQPMTVSGLFDAEARL